MVMPGNGDGGPNSAVKRTNSSLRHQIGLQILQLRSVTSHRVPIYRSIYLSISLYLSTFISKWLKLQISGWSCSKDFFFAVFKPHIFVFKFSILNSRVMTDMEVATQAKYGMIIIEGNLAKFHLHFSFFKFPSMGDRKLSFLCDHLATFLPFNHNPLPVMNITF